MKKLLAVLVAVAALATGCGIPLIPGQPIPGVQHKQPMKTWAPTPEPSATSTTPVPFESYVTEPPIDQAPPQPDPRPTSAVFENFTIEVTGTVGRPDFFAVKAKVCVTSPVNESGTRISTDPWTITTTRGKVIKSDKEPEFDEANFPRSGLYDKGECAKGWINFKTNGMKVQEIGYANSLENHALWDEGGERIPS